MRLPASTTRSTTGHARFRCLRHAMWLAAALAVGLLPQLVPAADLPQPGGGAVTPAAPQRVERGSVLVLSELPTVDPPPDRPGWAIAAPSSPFTASPALAVIDVDRQLCPVALGDMTRIGPPPCPARTRPRRAKASE